MLEEHRRIRIAQELAFRRRLRWIALSITGFLALYFGVGAYLQRYGKLIIQSELFPVPGQAELMVSKNNEAPAPLAGGTSKAPKLPLHQTITVREFHDHPLWAMPLMLVDFGPRYELAYHTTNTATATSFSFPSERGASASVLWHEDGSAIVTLGKSFAVTCNRGEWSKQNEPRDAAQISIDQDTYGRPSDNN